MKKTKNSNLKLKYLKFKLQLFNLIKFIIKFIINISNYNNSIYSFQKIYNNKITRSKQIYRLENHFFFLDIYFYF